MTEYKLHFGDDTNMTSVSRCSFREKDSFFDDDNITTIKVYNSKTGSWLDFHFMKCNTFLNYESTIKNLNEEIANLNNDISYLKTKEEHYETASFLFD